MNAACRPTVFQRILYVSRETLDFQIKICYTVGEQNPENIRLIHISGEKDAADAAAAMTKTVVLAVANQKGGVGKTTSAVNLAAAIAYQGHTVLLIDSDPQGNATSGLGISKKNLRRSLYDVLTGESAAADAVCETEFKNLSVLPATIMETPKKGSLSATILSTVVPRAITKASLEKRVIIF